MSTSCCGAPGCSQAGPRSAGRHRRGLAARRLGRVLLDPQAGDLRLPAGQVLSQAGSRTEHAAAVPIPAEIQSSRIVRRAWLHQSLAPLFMKRGWRAQEGEFCFGKAYPWARARILSNMHGDDELGHAVWLSMKLPGPLQSQIDSDGGPLLMLSLDMLAQRNGLAFTDSGEPGGWKGHVGYLAYKLPFANTDSAAHRRDELHALYDCVVLAWMDRLTSLERLEHWVNRVPDSDCPFLVLRQIGHDHLLWHYHPDLLLAAAVAAPTSSRAPARDRRSTRPIRRAARCGPNSATCSPFAA